MRDEDFGPDPILAVGDDRDWSPPEVMATQPSRDWRSLFEQERARADAAEARAEERSLGGSGFACPCGFAETALGVLDRSNPTVFGEAFGPLGGREREVIGANPVRGEVIS